MSSGRDHEAGGQHWKIRLVQALNEDPMFHEARFTFAVESESSGFETCVVFAPIYFHLASAADRLGLEDTAARLVELALDGGHRQDTRIRVSSAGVARVGEEPLSQLFRLSKPAPAPAPKSHHA